MLTQKNFKLENSSLEFPFLNVLWQE